MEHIWSGWGSQTTEHSWGLVPVTMEVLTRELRLNQPAPQVCFLLCSWRSVEPVTLHPGWLVGPLDGSHRRLVAGDKVDSTLGWYDRGDWNLAF